MGIRGLEWFCKDDPQTFETVDLASMAKDHFERYQIRPYIVVDFKQVNNFVNKIDNNHKDFILLEEVQHEFKKFVYSFVQHGIDLILLIDVGAFPTCEFCVRRTNQNESYRRDCILKKLNKVSFYNISRYDKQEFGNIFSNFYLYSAVVTHSSKFRIVRDRSQLKSLLAARDCLGILAQSSYYLVRQYIERYFSFRNLDLRTMSTIQYNPRGVAKKLGINMRYMPIFEVLTGHSLPTDVTDTFYRILIDETEDIKDLNSRDDIPRTAVFYVVANWINKHESDFYYCDDIPKQIAKLIGHPYLKNAISHAFEIISGCHNCSDTGTETKMHNKNWENIVSASKYCYENTLIEANVHFVIKLLTFRLPFKVNLIGNQQVGTIILTNLRRKLYGILLKERSIDCHVDPSVKVQETSFAFLKDPNMFEFPSSSLKSFTLVSPIYPDVHPGLLNLWTPDQCSEDEKLKLLCWAVSSKVKMESLVKIPTDLRVAALTLFYLIHEANNSGLRPSHIRALLAFIIYSQSLTMEDITKLEFDYTSKMEIHCGNLYKDVFCCICTVDDACGSPLKYLRKGTMFFNEKLFNFIYNLIENGSDFESLCDFDVDLHQSFVTFLDFQ